MAKDPAFLFYSSDFYTGTAFMTDEQVGKYIRLLCLQHQHGHLTEQHMINICKTYDEHIFSKFEKLPDGKYHNVRLHNEILKRCAYSESRRKNRTSKKDMSNICNSYDTAMSVHMENENKDISIIKNKDKREYSEEFELFWKNYPKKVGKGSSWLEWKKEKPDIDVCLKTLSWQKISHDWTKENGKWIVDPERWIKKRRWEDEPPKFKKPIVAEMFDDPEVDDE